MDALIILLSRNISQSFSENDFRIVCASNLFSLKYKLPTNIDRSVVFERKLNYWVDNFVNYLKSRNFPHLLSLMLETFLYNVNINKFTYTESKNIAAF